MYGRKDRVVRVFLKKNLAPPSGKWTSGRAQLDVETNSIVCFILKRCALIAFASVRPSVVFYRITASRRRRREIQSNLIIGDVLCLCRSVPPRFGPAPPSLTASFSSNCALLAPPRGNQVHYAPALPPVIPRGGADRLSRPGQIRRDTRRRAASGVTCDHGLWRYVTVTSSRRS